MKASYDRVAGSYDFLKSGDTRRWRDAQLEFFKGLYGRVLYVGIGTGQEIVHFPPARPGASLLDGSGQGGTSPSAIETETDSKIPLGPPLQREANKAESIKEPVESSETFMQLPADAVRKSPQPPLQKGENEAESIKEPVESSETFMQLPADAVRKSPQPPLQRGRNGIESVTAIDISMEMMKRSTPRVEAWGGKFRRLLMNAERLGFRDESFDCVLTVCVFCTVADPVAGFREIRRVLKPDGKVFAFEHVLSANPVYALILKGMNQITSRLSGTRLDRDTVGNMKKAGLEIVSDRNHYLDIVKMIEAKK